MDNTNDLTLTTIPDFGCEGLTIGRTLRFTDSSGNFYGESSQNNEWAIFSWHPADSSCTLIRPWTEEMGYTGKPQGKMTKTSGTTTIYSFFNNRIYPNPNTGTFTVELPEPAKSGMTFRITDLTGRLLQEQKTEPGSVQQTVRAGALPSGLYFLQVVSDGKVLAVEKFVKE